MSKNNYKCLINTSAPSCVIIITISEGINHSCNTLGTLNTALNLRRTDQDSVYIVKLLRLKFFSTSLTSFQFLRMNE